jgi:tetratricopeptide (TPR) repeat protein
LISILLWGSACSSTRTPAQRRADSIRWTEKALNEYRRGQIPNAIRLIRRAVASDSSHRQAREKLVQWLIADERYTDAIAAGSDFPYESGVAFFHLERWNDAVAALERVAVSDSQYAASRYYLGRTYLAMGSTRRAIRSFDDVPESSRLWKTRADIERQRLGRRFEDSVWTSIQRSDSLRRIEWAFLIFRVLDIPIHPSSSVTFRDIDSSYPLAPYARAAVEQGYLERLPDGRFYADYVVKRRNAAYYLWRLGGSDTIAVTAAWSDVPPGDWLAVPIHWVSVKNLVLPFRSDYFGAGEYLSGREAIMALQAFKVLWQRIHGQ